MVSSIQEGKLKQMDQDCEIRVSAEVDQGLCGKQRDRRSRVVSDYSWAEKSYCSLSGGGEKGGNKAELHRGILYIKKLEFGDMEF